MSSLNLPIVPRSPDATAGAIAQTLQDGSSPLDFIRGNLRPTPDTQAPGQSEVVQPAQPPVPTFVEPDQSIVPTSAVFTEADSVQLPPAPPAAIAAVEPQVSADKESLEAKAEPENELLKEVVQEKKKTKEDSIKDLRRKAQEFETALQEKERLLTEATTEVEKYKSGEAIPDIVRDKDERINELSYFEKIHNFKLSPEYQERFVLPMETLKGEASKIASDYGVDVEVLNEALKLENKRELNSYLQKHFDDVGAIEIRGVLEEMKKLHGESVEAEKYPEQEFEKLKTQRAQALQAEESKRVTTIINTSRGAWVDAVTDLRGTGEYPEITLTGDGDQDKVANSLLEQAASEFGKMTEMLGVAGLKEIPKDAAKILAKRFLLSQIVSVTAKSRAHHYERAEEVLKENSRVAGLLRPQVGGSSPGNGSAPRAPISQTPAQAAQQLLNQVLHKSA